MSFLDYLRQERRRTVSIYHQYRLINIRNERDVIVFVEGGDDLSFYLPIVRRKCVPERKIHSLVCDGKNGVLETRERIEKEKNYKGVRMYFVDKDLDDVLNLTRPSGPDIFYTNYYSIENYLVNVQTLKIVWVELFRMSDTGPRFVDICERFERAHQEFLRSMLIVMSWVVVRRRKQEQITFGDVNLEKYLLITDELEFRKKSKAFRKFRGALTKTWDRYEWRLVREVNDSLKAENPKKYVRGKFELWFLVKYLTKLDQYLRTSTNAGAKPKHKFAITLTNIIDILSPRCAVSPDLESFIDRALT